MAMGREWGLVEELEAELTCSLWCGARVAGVVLIKVFTITIYLFERGGSAGFSTTTHS
jgi:hypothetical protein